MTSLPWAYSRSFPLRPDWWKSDRSVYGEPQGNWRWKSNSRDVVVSSLSFSRPAARAPRRACSQARYCSGSLQLLHYVIWWLQSSATARNTLFSRSIKSFPLWCEHSLQSANACWRKKIKPSFLLFTRAKRSLWSPNLSLGGRVLSLMAGRRSSNMADEYCTR